MDDAGIHDTDDMAGGVQPDRERLAVGASRLECRVDARRLLPLQPRSQVRKSRRRVRAALMPHLAIRPQQRGREFRFGNIDPQHGVHRSLLSVASCAVSLVHASWARVSRFRYRSTGRHTLSAEC